LTSHKELYDLIASIERLGYVKPSFFIILLYYLLWTEQEKVKHLYEEWWPGDVLSGWRTEMERGKKR